MIVIQFERYPELCWHTTHQCGRTGERSASYISGLLSQELWWLFIKSAQQEETCSKIWIPSSSCRRLPVGEVKEGLASRILWKVWDIWLPSSIYMTPDSNYREPHPLLTFTKAFVIALPTNTARLRLALELAGLVCINQLIEGEDFKSERWFHLGSL